MAKVKRGSLTSELFRHRQALVKEIEAIDKLLRIDWKGKPEYKWEKR